jgi:prevent-host-death family protein
MIRINIADAKTHLSDYLEQLADGREDRIVVCKRNTPVAEILPLPQPLTEARPLGLGCGTIEVGPSFFEPLPADLLAAFGGQP